MHCRRVTGGLASYKLNFLHNLWSSLTIKFGGRVLKRACVGMMGEWRRSLYGSR